MVEVKIQFDLEEDATEFMDWMDGQGEDNYWIWVEENGHQTLRIEYDWGNFLIKTAPMGKK